MLPAAASSKSMKEKDNTDITENNKNSDLDKTKDCSVVLTTLKNLQDANDQNKITKLQDANITPPSHQEQPATRCTGRKRTVTDYKMLADYTEEDIIKP